MNRTRDFEDDDDKILKDGQVLRVSMTARDSRLSPLQRAVAASTADRARVTDGTDDWRGLHRPGYRMQVGDGGRTLVDESYRQRDLADANAWRTDARRSSESGFGSHGPIGQRVGDVCMTDDRREGRLKMIKGQFVCVPLKSQDENDSRDGMTLDQRQVAYSAYDEAISSAWKTPL